MHRLTASALLATPRVIGGGRRLLRSGTIAAVTHASQQQIGPRRWRWAAGVGECTKGGGGRSTPSHSNARVAGMMAAPSRQGYVWEVHCQLKLNGRIATRALKKQLA